MKLTLEKADESRLADCRKVFLASEIYDRYFKGEDRLERSLRTAAEKGELYLATAEDGRTVAGAMRVVMRGFCGLYPYLSLIGVKKDFRGERVGSFLMDRLEEMSRKSGAKRVTLMVSDFNTGAQAFYRGRGYRLLGTLPDAVKPGIDELILMKNL
jgi:ribosomal protein S18 acetylase RimI-like enzyme